MHPFFTLFAVMGVGRIFSRGWPVGDFPKTFSRGGPKVVKFGFTFYPSKLKNNLFLPIISKSRGDKAPLTPLPMPMYALCCIFRERKPNNLESKCKVVSDVLLKILKHPILCGHQR